MKPYFAHITEDATQQQTVYTHLTGTATLAAQFAAAFGASALGYRCGLLHDIGKYTDAFQKRLLQNGPRVDHSTAGMQEALKLGDLCASFCIAGHHGGLPDGGNPNFRGMQDGTFAARMHKQLPDYTAFSKEISIPDAKLPAYFGTDSFRSAFFIRMIYSCLVDADFLDTERFMSGGRIERGHYEDITHLLEQLMQFIAPWWNATNNLNEKRCAILKHCIQGAVQPKGFFSLTVPTGGGKTVSSMAFALEHAKAHGLRRIIYVIPYTSIIEQTAEVFYKIFGEEQVIPHYAAAAFSEDAQDAVSTAHCRRRLSTENWDAPIILTTAVQFFESLFANKPSHCRKLHNIANSVIIFDEAQMLPIPFLHPCLRAVTQLTLHYGCSAVLCTATQPALEPLLKEILPPEQSVRELCPDKKELYHFFRRVCYQSLDTLSDDMLSTRLQTHEQVLCIVNNRAQAQRLFHRLPLEDTFHLSTLMTPQHRKQTLDTIRIRLQQQLPCRVISTSLIEAGVDVDFPVVYRALAGLDSIIQAGGRCNREGKSPLQDSIVYIFRPETAPPHIFAQQIEATESVMRQFEDLASPEAIHTYFSFLLYTIKGSDALDKNQICSQLSQQFFPFATIADQFCLIETTAKTIYILGDAEQALLSQLQDYGPSRSLLRRLGAYAVSVYPQHFASLYAGGSVELLWDDIAVLRNHSLYDEHTGLSLENDEGQGYII